MKFPLSIKKNYISCDFLVSFYLLNKISKKKKMDYKSLFDVKDKVLWWAMFSIKKKKYWHNWIIEKVVLVTGGSRGIGEMIATVNISIKESVRIIINNVSLSGFRICWFKSVYYKSFCRCLLQGKVVFLPHICKMYWIIYIKKVAKELTAQGPGQCIAIPADLQKKSEIERLVAELSKKEDRKLLDNYQIVNVWINICLLIIY